MDYQALMTVQPAPTRCEDSVMILSPATFELFQKRGLPRVAELLKARKAFGLAKYGTPLFTYNGRDALYDAVQEVSDLLVYLVQQYSEAEHPVTPVDPQKNYALLDCLLGLIVSTGMVAEGLLVAPEMRGSSRTNAQAEQPTDTP